MGEERTKAEETVGISMESTSCPPFSNLFEEKQRDMRVHRSGLHSTMKRSVLSELAARVRRWMRFVFDDARPKMY
jgi:hypothetical protein